MEQARAGKAEDRGRYDGPARPGLYNRPRQPSWASFRSFLQALGDDAARTPRSFGGWRHRVRCERAAADLLFLILDESSPPDDDCVASQIMAGAAYFGYTVHVDRIEVREATGRDVFAIREITGRAFGTAGWGR